MENVKEWWKSKSIWGSLVVILAILLQFFGYTFSGDDQTSLVKIIMDQVAVGGAILAIFGRVKASKKIKDKEVG